MAREDLTVEMRDGAPYIVTSPLPEYITMSQELWDQILAEAPLAGQQPADGDPRWAWIEEVPHADPDKDNDGWVVHLNATNVYCSYRAAMIPEDGPIQATLVGWAEK